MLNLLDSLPERDKADVLKFLMVVKDKKSLEDLMIPEHVPSKIEADRQKVELEHKDKARKQILVSIIALTALLGLMAIITIVLLVYSDQPDFVEKLIYSIGGAVIGALSGGLAGFNFGKSKRGE